METCSNCGRYEEDHDGLCSKCRNKPEGLR